MLLLPTVTVPALTKAPADVKLAPFSMVKLLAAALARNVAKALLELAF